MISRVYRECTESTQTTRARKRNSGGVTYMASRQLALWWTALQPAYRNRGTLVGIEPALDRNRAELVSVALGMMKRADIVL
jgi:hypothetical protein